MQNTSLVDTAYNYLKDYAGDYHVLLEYKALLEENGHLSLSQWRAVLNCMVIDPALHEIHRRLPGLRSSTRRKKKEEKWRPARIEMRSKINYEFGISNHKLARVIHLVNPVGSGVTWYPHIDQLEAKVRWYCAAYGTRTGIILLKPEEVFAMLRNDTRWDYCRTCKRVKEGMEQRGKDATTNRGTAKS